MKGFKKDGKFRPTVKRNDSSLTKENFEKYVNSKDYKPLTDEQMKFWDDKLKLRNERIDNHQDPNTGEALKPHPDDEYWLKNTGHMARETNKEGKRYDDRGRVNILSEEQKKRSRLEIPFLKFAKDPEHTTKQLCGQIMCEEQGGSGMPNAYAQFKIKSVDESGHTGGLMYGQQEGDTICAGCLLELGFHSDEWEEEHSKLLDEGKTEDEAWIDDIEPNVASYDSNLPDFHSKVYKKPFEVSLMYGDLVLEYKPNGFNISDRDDDYY
jgi:hypothetical protein